MRRLIVFTLLWLAVLAPAAQARDTLPLHQGSSGPRCGDLKWLLSGHRPNKFDKVKGTFKWVPHSPELYYCGKVVMEEATVAYKFRLGWPAPVYRQPTAGKEFFDVVLGKKRWPVGYVIRAASRVKAANEGAVKTLAVRIKAKEVSQLGVAETQWNWSRTISSYQAVTGAYFAAWCVSFQQWAFLRGGYGTFADRTAGVAYATYWAGRRGYLFSKPKVGAIVVWNPRHMGFVTKISASGYSTIEGNASDAVRQRFYRWGLPGARYIYLPGVA